MPNVRGCAAVYGSTPQVSTLHSAKRASSARSSNAFFRNRSIDQLLRLPAYRQVGQRVRLEVAERLGRELAQVDLAIALVDHRRLREAFPAPNIGGVARGHVALEARGHRQA